MATSVGILIITVLYLQVAPRYYTVSMQIVPASTSNNPSAGGGLGALTRLAGMDLSDLAGGGSQFHLFVSALTSRDTADLLAKNQPLMQEMFPHEWSAADHKWLEPPSIVRPMFRIVERAVGYPVHKWEPPDGARLAKYLSDELEIFDDPKSPVVTLRVLSQNPGVAQDFLLALTNTVDSLLRRRALRRANDYVHYLSRELAKETVAEYRQALTARLGEQEQTLMMANADVSFAFQMFSSPSSSQSPSSPSAVVFLISAVVFGQIFGVVMCFLAEIWKWPQNAFSKLWTSPLDWGMGRRKSANRSRVRPPDLK